MILDGAKDAKAVYYVVGDEVGGAVVRPAMVAVVVALARLDVVGEGVRHLAVLSVAGYQVGYVVADHAPEPAALVALVGEVVADVCRSGDADLYFLGISPRLPRRVVHVLHGPLQDHGVGKLQDETVGLAPREAERFGTVA